MRRGAETAGAPAVRVPAMRAHCKTPEEHAAYTAAEARRLGRDVARADHDHRRWLGFVEPTDAVRAHLERIDAMEAEDGPRRRVRRTFDLPPVDNRPDPLAGYSETGDDA